MQLPKSVLLSLMACFLLVTCLSSPLATTVDPEISVSPTSMGSVQQADFILTQQLIITNNGGFPLNWNIDEDDSACDSPADVPWVTVAPDMGSTASTNSTFVDVTFDATGLTSGTYTANLCINSDDPFDPVVQVPLTLTVIVLPPQIQVFPLSLSASQLANLTTFQGFTIANAGNSPLEWTVDEDDTACDSPSDIPWLSLSQDIGITAAGDTDFLIVTFDSTGLTPGPYTGNLCVNSNDPGMPLELVSVSLEVLPFNQPPEAEDDAYATSVNTPLSVAAPGVLANDTDPDGDPLLVASITGPANGSVTQNPDGSFTYTPNPGFCDTDSYDYDACDSNGLCDFATVFITVFCVPDEADLQLTALNKGQPARAVVCAAPGINNDVHAGNGRALAHDADHNHLFYTERPYDVIFRANPNNAQPAGGVPQVCELMDYCRVAFPDGTPLPIGAMAYMDRNDFNPPAPNDILWLAAYDGDGAPFGPGDIWQLELDTDSADPFAPQRLAGGTCLPTLVTYAPLGRGEQCPLGIQDGFVDGLDFDPSPDLPGMNSLWISDDASDVVQRLVFPENPAASFQVSFNPSALQGFSIHKCNSGIAVDPTPGAANPIWLTEYAFDFRALHIEEVYLSQRPRTGLAPIAFEAAAYDMGLFGSDPADLGVQNARTWEDSEFDPTVSFPQFDHQCGVWAVENGTTVLRSGTNIFSNELLLIRFDVPCGTDAQETLAISQRQPISLTSKLENLGLATPVDVTLAETVDVPLGCDTSYLCQDQERIDFGTGVPVFELNPDGTLSSYGSGPVSFICAPGASLVAGGTSAAGEMTVTLPLLPNGLPIDVPVNFHQEFTKHCDSPGTKNFDFCVEVLPLGSINPLGVQDPNPGNNSLCVSETVEVANPCQPGPESQGYWHRQCLGLPAPRGIDPGRNGRGPQSPTEPDFDPGLMSCADLRLEDLGFFGMTTCQGMDANPPSDPCERAKKQMTALVLNVCSGRLTNNCGVNVIPQGCSATTVGGLLNELEWLISNGDCKVAAACAAAVNEGDAFP